MLVGGLLAFIFLLAILVTLGGAAVAWRRLTRPPAPAELAPGPVSIVRPICGIEPFSRETLESGFRLDHPAYELIFCAHSTNDPVLPIVRRLMEAYPHVPAHILFGDEDRTGNPKLDNCLKGWDAARHDWIVLADSNVDMPADYLQRLMRAWRPGTGLVCSMPLGTRPQGLWAHVECAFLNGFQTRWQYAAEAAGQGYAQGKSMLWRREVLDAYGGLRALAVEAAEDAAATKLVRRAGLHVRLVDAPFPQPIGSRGLVAMWRRQARWARLRCVTFPPLYWLECLTSPLVMGAGLAATAPALGLSPWLGLAAFAACYAAELALLRRLDWPFGPLTLPAMVVRDILLPAIWVAGFIGRQVSWHGRVVPVVRPKNGPLSAGALT